MASISEALFLPLLLLLFVAGPCHAEDHYHSVIVYGATPAGIAAAISAARVLGVNNDTSPDTPVVLVEPSNYLGGMAVAGGIGLRDLNVIDTINNTIEWEWSMLNAAYYKVNYPVYQPDMYVGQASFEQLLQQANVKVLYNFPLAQTSSAVTVQSTRITSIETTNGDMWYGKVYIDASYSGDIAQFAGVDYTYGRESYDTYNESLAGVLTYTDFSNFLPTYPVEALLLSNQTNSTEFVAYVDPTPLGPVGSADQRMMAYSYRLCITNNKNNQAPYPVPENYTPDDFIMLQRYIDTLVQSGQNPNGPSLGDLVDILNYRSYPPGDKWDMCDSQHSAVTSDAPYINDNYVNANYSERQIIEENVYEYVLGMMHYLSTDVQVPSYTQQSTNSYGLCADQWLNTSHVPPLMYVREGLRIIGDQVTTQHDLVGGICKNNSIALGSWPFDIHVVSRTAVEDDDGNLVINNEGQRFENVAGSSSVYEIEYSIMLPQRKQISNLLVPVCNSASHVAYASLRVEPCFIFLGQSAGIAAALSLQQSTPTALQDVPVTLIQQELQELGISYHSSSSCQ